MDAARSDRPVVVGVDDSEVSLAAVDWAVGEASSRNGWLRVVHAFIWPLFPHVPLGPSAYGPPDGGLRAAAERIVDDSVRRAATGAAGLRVEGALVTGAADMVMLTEARSAELVVVGSRGLGGFTGLLVGSVSAHLAAHAPCSIVVIRPASALRNSPGATAVCVVGIDDPSISDEVLAFAFAEASRLGLALTVVHCMAAMPAQRGIPQDTTEKAWEIRSRLSDAVAPWRQKYPGIRAEIEVVSKPPARTLVEMSRQALLVVVGSHGAGGFRGMLLGSTSQQVLHHAAAPVAIVRGTEVNQEVDHRTASDTDVTGY